MKMVKRWHCEPSFSGDDGEYFLVDETWSRWLRKRSYAFRP